MERFGKITLRAPEDQLGDFIQKNLTPDYFPAFAYDYKAPKYHGGTGKRAVPIYKTTLHGYTVLFIITSPDYYGIGGKRWRFSVKRTGGGAQWRAE